MDIQGKIIVIGEPRSGVSARTNQPWKSQDFVIETTTDQYPRRCCFSVFGEDKLQQFNIQMGEELTVSFDIDAHEYNGRWYNSIRAWRVTRGAAPAAPAAAQPAQVAPAAPAPDSVSEPVDDLPF
ncbi:MAG: DUF3127 domain-containing protein [Bacteroidaceae bacterium]|nr:DUF3127 domain-containing protein [Bacteroidaceae bacterium]